MRVMHYLKIVGIVLLEFISIGSFAQQDPSLMHFTFNAQLNNPAYAGTWQSMGITAITRQQWVGWNGAPKTYTLSLQTPVNSENVGLGVHLINDVIGKEKRFGVWGDYSYLVKLSDELNIRMGMRAGFTNYSCNYSSHSLVEDNDPAFHLNVDNVFLPNLGTGLFLYSRSYYLGLSVPKLLHAKILNENPNNFSLQGDLRHYYVQGGCLLGVNKPVKFKPGFILSTVRGAPLKIDMSTSFLLVERLWLGAILRSGNAVGFIANWIINSNVCVGYAYDFDTGKVKCYQNASHEMMVTYKLSNLKSMAVTPFYF